MTDPYTEAQPRFSLGDELGVSADDRALSSQTSFP